MSRPTIALCMIAKNEAHNLGPLLQSVRGCFDQIVIVDTGSTDNTVQFLEKINEHIKNQATDFTGLPPIQIEHFEWVNDFAKARSYSFSFAKTDYVAWLDCDDVLSDKAAFIKWRDHVMHSAHYWVAVYNYAFDKEGKVVCQFIRERVIKRNHGFEWEYLVHEGLLQKEGKKYWPQRVSTWCVNHRRSDEDRQQDHMRNVKLMEQSPLAELPPRMQYYYGKELVENGFPEKAGKALELAIKSDKLELHDRILAIEYAARSAFSVKAYASAIDLLMNGLRIVPARAEYWCLMGDVYLSAGDLDKSIFCYKTASECTPNTYGGMVVCSGHAYGEYPFLQLATIFTNTGNISEAEKYLQKLAPINPAKAAEISSHLDQVKDLSIVRKDLPKVDHIIITCPPNAAVTDWDENTLKEKGTGGSETAAIEVAKWIRTKTGKTVKIFQPRRRHSTMESGVEYVPIRDLAGYLHNVEPKAHIAWRHSTRLTNAPSYVWCHDLQLPGAEKHENYDKIIALSEFHKHYLTEVSGADEKKIVLGFNGINPEDFEGEVTRNPLKVVFSSSPDRGLIQCIEIVKRAREISGLDLEFHCFYGFENMRKMGHGEWADGIEKVIKDNAFVKYHGNVNKKELMKHFKEAAVWLYPADFIETYCITAIEALCAGAWPIVRRMGALPYTMREAIEKGMCDFLDVEAKDDASFGIWANVLVEAILDKKWEKVSYDTKANSWEMVADHFIKELSLGT